MTSGSCPAQMQWRQLQASEAPALFDLHQRIAAQEPPSVVRRLSLNHFEQLLQTGETVYAGFANSAAMVAYGIYSRTSPICNDLAQRLGLTDAQRQNFAVLDGSGVLRPWRGKGLQEHLIRIRMRQGQQDHCGFLGATVAPDNAWSLYNLLQAGFQIQTSALLYGGVPRLLLCYQANRAAAAFTDHQNIACSDFESQAMALRNGWRGTAALESPKTHMSIRYSR